MSSLLITDRGREERRERGKWGGKKGGKKEGRKEKERERERERETSKTLAHLTYLAAKKGNYKHERFAFVCGSGGMSELTLS